MSTPINQINQSRYSHGGKKRGESKNVRTLEAVREEDTQRGNPPACSCLLNAENIQCGDSTIVWARYGYSSIPVVPKETTHATAKATSRSLARMAGASAVIAVTPHMLVPAAINAPILVGAKEASEFKASRGRRDASERRRERERYRLCW